MFLDQLEILNKLPGKTEMPSAEILPGFSEWGRLTGRAIWIKWPKTAWTLSFTVIFETTSKCLSFFIIFQKKY